MWLINTRTLQLESFEGDRIPRYAILSHRWEDEEVSFKDMMKQRCHGQKGYQKIRACCRQALSDGLEYAWVDTCCVDKRSSAELSEAVNSMFRWYRKSEVCYAFLSDMPLRRFEDSLWFTRGWTLQELLAPTSVTFFDSTWTPVGSKAERATEIRSVTGIPREAMFEFDPIDYCVAEKMRWAANRRTTRVEDRAYSLLGLFQINMPLLYGEADHAFTRLQREIMEAYSDSSIFSVSAHLEPSFAMLGTCPESFELSKSHDRELFSMLSRDLFHASKNIFACTKQGIVGNFQLHHYAFDIFMLDLCDWAVNIFLFVQWNHEAETFQRVEIDGMRLIDVGYHERAPIDLTRPEIKIGRLPLKTTTSTALDWWQSRFYVDWHTNRGLTNMSSGRFFAELDSRPEHPLETSYKLSFPTAADNSHQDLETNEPRQCLCVGSVKQGVVRLDTVIHFGTNVHGSPQAFVSRVEAQDRTVEHLSRYRKYRKCHTGGYCRFSGPVADRDQVMPNKQWTVPVDELDDEIHRVVRLVASMNIHFVLQRNRDPRSEFEWSEWRVYIETIPEDDRNNLPHGWRLPQDRRVINPLVIIDSCG